MVQPMGLLLPNKEFISNFDNHAWLTLGSTYRPHGVAEMEPMTMTQNV